jgi:16S rRNA (adenine1518-N6/adenine1519-N6)-dimethyltransferase
VADDAHTPDLRPWTRARTRQTLADAGLAPRKRHGQNFLTDHNLLEAIVRDAQIAPAEQVLEIGPGTGELTAALLRNGGRVIAVEIDAGLAALVRRRFEGSDRLELIEGDALQHGRFRADLVARLQQTDGFKLVANLPYSAGTPLLLDLCVRGDLPWQMAVVTVQREVAQRLAAAPGTAAYGTASIICQVFADVEILRKVPPDVFWPRPQVRSAVVRLLPHHRATLAAAQRQSFADFVRAVLRHRRKVMPKAAQLALPNIGEQQVVEALHHLELPSSSRAETLSPDQFLALFGRLAAPHGR